MEILRAAHGDTKRWSVSARMNLVALRHAQRGDAGAEVAFEQSARAGNRLGRQLPEERHPD